MKGCSIIVLAALINITGLSQERFKWDSLQNASNIELQYQFDKAIKMKKEGKMGIILGAAALLSGSVVYALSQDHNPDRSPGESIGLALIGCSGVALYAGVIYSIGNSRYNQINRELERRSKLSIEIVPGINKYAQTRSNVIAINVSLRF